MGHAQSLQDFARTRAARLVGRQAKAELAVEEFQLVQTGPQIDGVGGTNTLEPIR
jgi:hypothetical protein